MKTYADLLRGKIYHIEEDAKKQLKNTDDAVFWWESNEIWGYTTKELVKEAVLNAKEEDEKIKQSLIQMCDFLRMDKKKTRCDTFNKCFGETVAEYINLTV